MPDSNGNREDEYEGRPELVKKRARVIFLRNMAILLVVLYMFFTSAVSTINAFTGQAARAELLDCTTTEGKCFQRNQKSSGDIVQKIVDEITTTRKVSVLAAACSTDPSVVNETMTKSVRIDAIDKCVNDALLKEKEEKEK